MKIRDLKLTIVFLLCLVGIAYGQKPNRKYQNHLFDQGHLIVKVNDGEVRFTPYTDNILEVYFLEKGKEYIDSSHAVVLRPTKVEVFLKEELNYLSYKTGNLSVRINKEPFQVTYSYSGEQIIGEKEGFFDVDSLFGFKFQLQKDEILLGAGERSLGMNRRGHRLELYNKPSYGYEQHAGLMYFSLPIVLSSAKYMILWDNAPKGFLDMGKTEQNTLSIESIGGKPAYFLIAGDEVQDIVSSYTLLTGRQPLPPRWLFGNIASRFGYHSEKEASTVINTFQKDKIPVDGIVFDIFWFGKDIKGHMGNLAWDKDAFPDPEGMMGKFKGLGVKTVLITEPFVLKTSKRWQEAVDNDVLCLDSTGTPYTYDFYFGTTGLIDIFKPRARRWFWDIYKMYMDIGVGAWWGDLGEPEYHPSGIVHTIGRADEVHNIYGHYWAKMVYDGYRKDYPMKRPFVLMRAGFAGSQRFGMVPWSGDVNRTWGGFKPQVEIATQMALQGMAYMHSDLGGFAGANKDGQLYTRWLQYGVFQPVFRPHAQEEVPSEPIFWDDSTKWRAKKAIELRYKLLPYNYTLAFVNSQKGTPLMRPLFYEEPDNYPLYNYDRSYMWGDAFLVSPVTGPDTTSWSFYVPKGIWFDFRNDEVIDGGREITTTVDLNSIPVFVKAGAFVPMSPVYQSTDEYTSKDLAIHYYSHKGVPKSHYQMYNDDGVLAGAYDKGQYEFLDFDAAQLGDNQLKIEMDRTAGTYVGRPVERNIAVIVHNVVNMPKQIQIGEKVLKLKNKKSRLTDGSNIVEWDGANHTATIKFVWKGSKEVILVQ